MKNFILKCPTLPVQCQHCLLTWNDGTGSKPKKWRLHIHSTLIEITQPELLRQMTIFLRLADHLSNTKYVVKLLIDITQPELLGQMTIFLRLADHLSNTKYVVKLLIDITQPELLGQMTIFLRLADHLSNTKYVVILLIDITQLELLGQMIIFLRLADHLSNTKCDIVDRDNTARTTETEDDLSKTGWPSFQYMRCYLNRIIQTDHT